MRTSLLKGWRVLITGGTGFIGSRLSERLLNEGCRITVITRQCMKPTVAYLMEQGVEIVQGDVIDWESLTACKHLGSFDIVLHFAANVSLWGDAMRETNIEGTRNVLRLTELVKATRFVFASSIEAQGPGAISEIPLTEEHPCQPISPYGDAKRQGEILTEEFAQRTGIPTLIARIGNTYGIGGLGFVQPFLYALFTNNVFAKALPYISNRWIQPIYVDDLVEALVRALSADLSGIYNFTGNQPVTVGEWLITIGELLEVERLAYQRLNKTGLVSPEQIKGDKSIENTPEVAYYLMAEDERVHRIYSDAKLRAKIGDYQRYNLYRGSAATIAWYQKERILEPIWAEAL